MVALFLLSLVLEKTNKYEEKPALLVAVDNSQSMLSDGNTQPQIEEYITQIKNTATKKYKVELVRFGDEIDENMELDFSSKTSDYASLINYIAERYYNLNLGGVMLIGDGIYNVGRNPAQFVQNITAPIYTLGVGDTTVLADQAIIGIQHNRSVFKGNKFQLEVELNFTDFNHSSTKLSIYQGNKLINEKQVNIPQANYYTSQNFSIEANESGLQTYSVVLESDDEEFNKDNNQKRFNIRVHENKYEVLVLTNAPHPDIGTQISLLNEEANFEVSIAKIDEFNGELKNYNAVVLYQLPASSQGKALLEKIVEQKKSMLVVVGPSTSLAALNNLELGVDILPTTVFEEVTPNFNSSFSMFGVPQELFQMENYYSPLLTPFAKIVADKNYETLAYQTINGVDLDLPLIIAGNYHRQKIAFIFGEGIWRWGLQEYLNFGSKENVNKLMINLLTYLSIDSKEDRFKLQYRQIVPENNQIRFQATLLNEIFEPVTNESIQLQLIDSANVEYKYVFDAGEMNYSLNIGYLNEGKYQFSAKASVGKDTLLKSGSFIVQKIDFEQENKTANFNLLKSIASNTNGQFETLENKSKLLTVLMDETGVKTKVHQVKSINDLIDLKILFLGLTLLLFAEWFLRKFWGSY